MLTGPLGRAALACLALASAATVAGCGPEEEARREGLALPLGDATYNVFITRQLNLNDVEDRGYARLPSPAPASTYYGVFLEVCNESDVPARTASSFTIVDTQENEFGPIELKADNPFAYEPTTLEPDECIPPAGSVASQGPTGGALLVFEIPLESTENRPLELEVSQGFDPATAGPRQLVFELDI